MYHHRYICDALLPGASHTLWFHPLLVPGKAGVCPSALMPVGKLKALAGEDSPNSPGIVLAGVSSSGTCDRRLAESCRLPRSWQRGVKAALLLHKPGGISGLVTPSPLPAHHSKQHWQANLVQTLHTTEQCSKSANTLAFVTMPVVTFCTHPAKMYDLPQDMAEECTQRAWRQ